MKTFIAIVAGLVATVGIAGGALYLGVTILGGASPAVEQGRGGDSNYDSIVLESGLTIGGAGSLNRGTSTSPASIAERQVIGTCADATTTIFALLNPYSATSTFELRLLTGINGTTSIALYAGSSTTAYAPKNGNVVSTSVVNATPIATSTSFDISGGVGAGCGVGCPSAGAGTAIRVLVGPSQYIVGQATSSTAGAYSSTELQGITNTTNTFSCTYKGLWMN